MSLEAIEKVTQVEAENKERKAAAEAEAQRLVADAEREGLALLQQARTSAAESGKELGCHILAPHATEMIGEMTLAIANGLTAVDVGNTIHPHPTVSEILMEAAHDVDGRCCYNL